MKKMLWLSDQVLGTTGFANQTKEILKRMSFLPDWNINHIAWNYQGQHLTSAKLEDGEEFGFNILGGGKQPYAMDRLSEYFHKIRPDVFVVLLDTFMLYNPVFLNQSLAPSRFVMYFPTDGEWFPDHCEDILKKSYLPVAMSEHGQAQVKNAFDIDAAHIPHACNVDLFKPASPEEKAVARQKLGIPSNAFVFGDVARNQGRKNLPDTLVAFKRFLDLSNADDAFLMLHCDVQDPAQQTNLPALAQKLGIAHRVVFTGMRHFSGFTASEMPSVFHAMDVRVSTTCFHPDTPISTSKGFKKIKDVEIGDEVLTKDGSFQKTEDVVSYDYEGDLVEIETNYNPKVKVTPNHLIYGMKCKNKSSLGKGKLKERPKVVLLRADKFTEGDYFLVPRIKKTVDKDTLVYEKNYVTIDEDLMWLFGYYLAEGCLSQRRGKPEGIIFCCSTEEHAFTEKTKRIVKAKFGLECKVHDTTRHRRTIRVYNSALGRKFKALFSSGAHNKTMPEWMLYLPKNKQKQLVQGYIDGDGHHAVDKRNGSKQISVDTVSENLAYFMRAILIRLGIEISFKTAKRQSKVYRLRFTTSGKARVGWFDRNFFYVRVGKVTRKKHKGLVYDLTVNKNHNYCNYWLGKNTGEGFGICTVESMACGIPQIVTDYTSTPELLGYDLPDWDEKFKKFDWLSDRSNKWGDTGIGVPISGELLGAWNVFRGYVDVDAFAGAMLDLYSRKSDRVKMASVGRDKAVSKYSWDVVFPQWKDLLDKVAVA